MNELGISLLWAAVQGTLLLGAAIILYLRAARHGPRAASWVAGAALISLVLTAPLAFCPLPSWCHWPIQEVAANSPTVKNLSEIEVGEGATNNAAQSATSDSRGPSVSLATLWASLRRMTTVNEQQPSMWPRIIAAAFLVGTGIGLLYLLLGLAAVRSLRRRSRPISDPGLSTILQSMPTSAGGAVELRESRDIGSAATVGWRRPLVLLPQDWRNWSADECRAVLAHELAHIGRRDYAIWLLARLGVALHFYNPLAHWLANRLQLQQELAADAYGAECMGGTHAYLQAVARLALRQDRWLRCWPARAFLASGGTWMRRIAMLQSKKPMQEKRWSALRRWGIAGVLVAVATGASALRGATEPPKGASDQPNAKVVPAPVPVARRNLPPIDLSYVPQNAKGVYGFRPAVLANHPDIKPFVAGFDALMAKEFAAVMGFKGEFDLKVEDIEQMTGIIEFQRTADNKNALLTGFSMMRIAHDYDWAKHIKIWLPEVTVLQHQGHNYFKAPKGLLPILGMGLEACAFVPDGRTIVCGDEAYIKGVIDNLGKPHPRPEWMNDWRAVDQDWLAVALDNRDFHLVHDINKDGKPPMPLTPICEKATSLVFGVDGSTKGTAITLHADGTEMRADFGSNLIIRGRARCADEKTASEVKQTIEALFKQGREWAAIAPVATDAKNKSAGQALSDLLNPTIEQHDTTVGIRAETKQSLIAIKDAFDALDAHADTKVEK